MSDSVGDHFSAVVSDFLQMFADLDARLPKYGRVLVGSDQLRQVFNDTDDEGLWESGRTTPGSDEVMLVR